MEHLMALAEAMPEDAHILMLHDNKPVVLTGGSTGDGQSVFLQAIALRMTKDQAWCDELANWFRLYNTPPKARADA